MSRCPSHEQLAHLLGDELTGAEQRNVTLHIASCARCQSALERLTDDSDGLGGALASVVWRDIRSRGSPAADLPADFLSWLRLPPTLPSAAASQGIGSPSAKLPRVSGYEILGELGRGGMGVVYKARQVGLNRLVAIKMILAGARAAPGEVTRFRHEAEAVARLHHPNIVQIFDIGEVNGCPYFVMEYVEDGSLVQRLRGDPQPVQATARLMEALARATHFAHQHQIVHRDLKPANILLQMTNSQTPRTNSQAPRTTDQCPTPGKERLDSGQWPLVIPKITDFGLAKRLDKEMGARQREELAGTPSYMAPEQAVGRGAIGPAADVYALGAILYEMLTGRPPFKGATPLDTVVQVLHEEPVRPSRLRPRLPRDLETICLKCLHKDPARRYRSAGSLAEELHRFRQGKPIHARPGGPVVRGLKWARRRPGPAALLLGIVLVTLIGFAGVTWQWQETRVARDAALEAELDTEAHWQEAERARGSALAERRRARTALYFSRIAQARLQWRLNDLIGAGKSLEKCRPRRDYEDRRGWEWHHLRGLLQTALHTLPHRAGAPGGGLAYSPDGRWIASVVGGHPRRHSELQAEVCLWDAHTGDKVWSRRTPGTVHRLVFRPDGRQLALAATDGTVYLWEVAGGKERVRLSLHARPVTGLAFSPDGKYLASAGWDATVKVCDARTGRVLRTLRKHGDRIQSVAFHPTLPWLASTGWDAKVRICDVTNGREVRTLRGHRSAVSDATFSPDGKLLASAGSNGNLRVWDLATGRVVQSVTGQTGTVLGIAFSPDGRYLAYGGGDATVRSWGVDSGVERVVFRGHTHPVEAVRFSPDGRCLASLSPLQAAVKVWDLTRHPEYATFARTRGSARGVVKVWDLLRRPAVAVRARTGPDLEGLAFDRTGKHLISVTVGGKLQTRDAATGVLKAERELPVCDELLSPAVIAAFSPGGQRLAARVRKAPSLVQTREVASGRKLITFRGHTLPVLCVRFSADGRRLATCACDPGQDDRRYELKVWSAASGRLLSSLSGRGLVCNVVFSPDGRWLALGKEEGQVWLLDWASGGKVVSLRGHKSAVAALAFGPHGQLLASAEVEGGILKLWKLNAAALQRGEAPRPVTRPAPVFLCDLAFSPDGRRLAGISRDSTKLWDVETGHEVLTLWGAPQRHWDPAFNPRVIFSPDGKRLAGTNWDETISLWDAEEHLDDRAETRNRTVRQQAARARAPLWHLQEADECLEHDNRPAARFHLRHLESMTLKGPLQEQKDRLLRRLQP